VTGDDGMQRMLTDIPTGSCCAQVPVVDVVTSRTLMYTISTNKWLFLFACTALGYDPPSHQFGNSIVSALGYSVDGDASKVGFVRYIVLLS
jgi:hypothetical protein